LVARDNQNPPAFAADAGASAAKANSLPNVVALTAKLIHPPGKLAGVSKAAYSRAAKLALPSHLRGLSAAKEN